MNAFFKTFLPLCWPLSWEEFYLWHLGVMVLVGIGLSAVSSSFDVSLYIYPIFPHDFGNRPRYPLWIIPFKSVSPLWNG